MADEISPVSTVVNLDLRIDGYNNQIRVSATVESYVGGRRLYNEHREYVTTWQEVLTFLGSLLASADASRPVATYLSLTSGT